MSADGLVARLHAAIEEVERRAKPLRRERWFAVQDDTIGGWAVANVNRPVAEHDPGKGEASVGDFLSDNYAAHIAAHNPIDVLRLCQAHRDILAMYVEAKAQPVVREGREAKLRGLGHASAMGRLTTLGLVLQALARGYGVGDGERGE